MGSLCGGGLVPLIKIKLGRHAPITYKQTPSLLEVVIDGQNGGHGHLFG